MKEVFKELLFPIGLIAIGFVFGALVVGAVVCEAYQDEAVEKGKAEYYLDASNEKKWRWKE